MSDEKNNENVGNTSGNNKVAETINAATGLVKAIPVYQDLAQPAAQELGKSLHTVAKLVNVALAPVSACVWGYEKIKEFVDTKVTEKLKNINPEDIVSPLPNVAGPALEALKYTGCNEKLSDMYACLLASAMDKNKASSAHPAFVEIIKQLTPDEARIIEFLKKDGAGRLLLLDLREVRNNGMQWRLVLGNYSVLNISDVLELPNLSGAYIDNICRLGLGSIPDDTYSASDNAESHYDMLKKSAVINSVMSKHKLSDGAKFDFNNKYCELTSLGWQFIAACVS